MADDFAAGIDALRQRMQGMAPAQPGKPPLASFHESVRLLPNQALKALGEAGVDLMTPSKDDRQIIDDLRVYNKLPKWTWPEPPRAAGAPSPEPGGSPRH